MTRVRKVLIVLVVASLGLWGCAKGPGSPPVSQAERIKGLETKCAKLEDDYRAVASARDQVRKRAAALQQERDQLREVLQKERDELQKQVSSRTVERDALQTRCDRLKKGLQSLLGQDEALMNKQPGAGTTNMTASK